MWTNTFCLLCYLLNRLTTMIWSGIKFTLDSNHIQKATNFLYRHQCPHALLLQTNHMYCDWGCKNQPCVTPSYVFANIFSTECGHMRTNIFSTECKHTHTHKRMHACTHAHTHTHTHMHTHTHTHTHTA